MADVKQELILEINVERSINSTAALRQELDALIKIRQELSEKSKAGDLEATKNLERVNSTIRNSQTEYKAQQRVIDGYVASKKQEVNTSNLTSNSIQTNRDLLKQLTAQYIQLKNPSENATSQIRHLTEVLKQQESAIGNNTRNVGNYKESIVGAFKEISVGGVSVGAIVDPLKNITNGFKNAGGGIAGFQGALVGAVPLVIAGISAIASQLQKFDAISEGLEDSLMGVDRALDTFIAVGGQAFTGFGDLADTLERAYDEGVKLSEVLRQLGEAEDIQRVSNASAQKQIEALLLQSKDRTKSEAERIALLDEASKKEEANLKQNIALSEERVRLAQEEFKRVIETGLNDDEAKKRLNQANINLINQQRESANLQEKIINRRNALIEAGIAEQEKLQAKQLADEKKAAEERQKLSGAEFAALQADIAARAKYAAQLDAANKKAEADKVAAATRLFNTEQTILSKQLENDLLAADLSVGTAEEKERRKQEIQLNSYEKQLDLAIQFLGADGDITKAELQGIESLQLAIKKAQQTLATPAKESKATFGSALGVSKEDIGGISQGLQQVQGLVNGIQDIASAATQVRLNEIETQKNAEIEAVNESTLSEEEKAKKIQAIEKQAAREKYEAEKAAFETNKALQIVNAIIGGAVGVVNAFQLGPIAGAIAAAVIAATTAAQIAVIASQGPPPPPAGFAGGVIGLDGPGSETSDSVPARLSRGESVMTARATKQYHRELAWMEQSVGNSPNYQFGKGQFAGGFIPTVATVTRDGGYVARDLQRSNDSASIAEAIKAGFRLAPATKLDIVELNRKQSGLSRSVEVSEI